MFEVGQRVVIKTRHGYGMVGTVLRITEKRKDVVVQFSNYKANYGLDGWEKGADVWSMSRIVPLTEDVEEEIAHLEKISKCRELLKEVPPKLNSLTDGQLDDIISVLSKIEVGQKGQ